MRTGLGRHGGLDDRAGDPLDGLVNLFDIGIVLAVAFLLAGLGLTLDAGRRMSRRNTGPAARRLVRTLTAGKFGVAARRRRRTSTAAG